MKQALTIFLIKPENNIRNKQVKKKGNSTVNYAIEFGGCSQSGGPFIATKQKVWTLTSFPSISWYHLWISSKQADILILLSFSLLSNKRVSHQLNLKICWRPCVKIFPTSLERKHWLKGRRAKSVLCFFLKTSLSFAI